MTDWKKIGKKLLFPPLWLIIILVIITAASLAFVFIKELVSHPIAYIIYVIAFYTLSVVCIFCGIVFPKKYKRIKEKIYSNKFGNRYMTDGAFRTHISLYFSLTVNLIYIGANALFCVLYNTAWFGILAGYYIILAIMRFLLLRYINKNTIGLDLLGEWKRARVCAAVLTLINLSLSGAILMIMYQDKGFEYNGIFIYVMALHAFYMITLAVVNIIKYRKLGSPVITTAKIVTLAAALISMLSLETAMLNAFGADTPQETKQILIAATGAGISVIVLAMSSYMIIRSTKEIDELNKEIKNNER